MHQLEQVWGAGGLVVVSGGHVKGEGNTERDDGEADGDGGELADEAEGDEGAEAVAQFGQGGDDGNHEEGEGDDGEDGGEGVEESAHGWWLVLGGTGWWVLDRAGEGDGDGEWWLLALLGGAAGCLFTLPLLFEGASKTDLTKFTV